MTTCWDLHNIPVAILVDKLDCEIMQFTGLLDKNGVEIYEGDILRFSHGKPDAVRWDDLDCGFFPFTMNASDEGIEDSTEMEVIGNIHENPELLNDK